MILKSNKKYLWKGPNHVAAFCIFLVLFTLLSTSTHNHLKSFSNWQKSHCIYALKRPFYSQHDSKTKVIGQIFHNDGNCPLGNLILQQNTQMSFTISMTIGYSHSFHVITPSTGHLSSQAPPNIQGGRSPPY